MTETSSAKPDLARRRSERNFICSAGEYKMRAQLPYGIWTCADGREVLFNRWYEAIWQRYPGQMTRAADPDGWVDWSKQDYFFDDGNSPWRKPFDSKNYWRCVAILREWGAPPWVQPLDFVLHPEQRKRMAAVAIAHSEELRRLVARMTAFRMVENTNTYRNRHFFVIDDCKPVPFVTHWRYKKISGVSFGRNEFAAAVVWVERALLASFTVFYSNRRHGGGAGRGLDSIYGEDEWWLYQELKARGIESESCESRER